MAASYDYMCSAHIARDDWPIPALLMAAMRKADADNLTRLIEAFPEVWAEYQAAAPLATHPNEWDGELRWVESAGPGEGLRPAVVIGLKS